MENGEGSSRAWMEGGSEEEVRCSALDLIKRMEEDGSWKLPSERRIQVPHVRQQHSWDCGVACVLMVLKALQVPIHPVQTEPMQSIPAVHSLQPIRASPAQALQGDEVGGGDDAVAERAAVERTCPSERESARVAEGADAMWHSLEPAAGAGDVGEGVNGCTWMRTADATGVAAAGPVRRGSARGRGCAVRGGEEGCDAVPDTTRDMRAVACAIAGAGRGRAGGSREACELQHLHRQCGTTSVWSIDLVALLQRHGVGVEFLTVTIGANPSFAHQPFYKENIPGDVDKVDPLCSIHCFDSPLCPTPTPTATAVQENMPGDVDRVNRLFADTIRAGVRIQGLSPHLSRFPSALLPPPFLPPSLPALLPSSLLPSCPPTLRTAKPPSLLVHLQAGF
ncbi:unnamed protein product [Closterium sp. NIES-65]|nr:unnamed protein product [Closterium sp. NIES-65]